MADYNPSRKTRTKRNELPSNYIYDRYDQDVPKPVSPRPITKPVEDEKYAEARKKSAENNFVSNVSLLYTELEDLLLSKHNDYGPSNIANAPGGALNGLRVRMHDKLARINNLVDKDINPEHESLEDSFKDMANYAIIGLLVLRGKWNK